MLMLLDRPTLLKIVTPADRKDIYDNIQRLHLALVEQVTINDNVTETDIIRLLGMIEYYLEKHKDATDVLSLKTGKMIKCILKDVDCFLPENTPEQRNVTLNILRSILYHARRYDRAVAKHKRKQVRIINEKYDMNLKLNGE